MCVEDRPPIVCGKPQKPCNEHATSRFCEKLNGHPVPKNVPFSSEQRYYFKRDCGKHYCYITAEAANKDLTDNTWQRCKLCHPGSKAPPNLELLLLDIVANMKDLQGCQVVTQPRVLNSCGGVDFMLVATQGQQCTRLLIETDGARHFPEQHKKDGWKKQWKTDRQKDKAAKEGRWHLLRLHHLDTEDFEEEIAEAWKQAQQEPHKPFVRYSVSYRPLFKELANLVEVVIL